jgi:hypothetical protein
MGAAATVRDGKSGKSASTPGASYSLSIIECFGRNITEKDGIQVA